MNKKTTIIDTVEQIKQNSTGFSQGLELLTNFDNAESSPTIEWDLTKNSDDDDQMKLF